MRRARAAARAFWIAAVPLACALAAHAATPPDAPAALTPEQYAQHFHTGDHEPGIPMRVRVSPAPARIGQAITYRGVIRVHPDVSVRFEPPQSAGNLTWSHVRAGRSKTAWLKEGSGPDSVWFEARLQVFEAGPIAVPGPVVQLNPMPGTRRPGTSRLPTMHLMVLPTITAADSNAELRALHGPLAAPWWERVPWVLVVAGLVLIAAGMAVVRAMRRRKPRPAPRAAPGVALARPRLDPAAAALRAIAALRASELPAAGRFGEHALELTAILRRFLEATLDSPRPGDTSGELLVRFKASRMPEDDFDRLEGLLALWDRVKFARAPLTEAEAKRCEDAVEGYVRRVAQARMDAAAAAARAAAARAGVSPRGPVQPGASPPPAPEAA